MKLPRKRHNHNFWGTERWTDNEQTDKTQQHSYNNRHAKRKGLVPRNRSGMARPALANNVDPLKTPLAASDKILYCLPLTQEF